MSSRQPAALHLAAEGGVEETAASAAAHLNRASKAAGEWTVTRYLTGRGEESAYSANLRASGGIQGALDGWLPAVGCRLPSLRRREPPGVSQNPATWEMMATCWRSFQKPSPNSLRCGPAVLQLLRAYLIFVLSRFGAPTHQRATSQLHWGCSFSARESRVAIRNRHPPLGLLVSGALLSAW